MPPPGAESPRVDSRAARGARSRQWALHEKLCASSPSLRSHRNGLACRLRRSKTSLDVEVGFLEARDELAAAPYRSGDTMLAARDVPAIRRAGFLDLAPIHDPMDAIRGRGALERELEHLRLGR